MVVAQLGPTGKKVGVLFHESMLAGVVIVYGLGHGLEGTI